MPQLNLTVAKPLVRYFGRMGTQALAYLTFAAGVFLLLPVAMPLPSGWFNALPEDLAGVVREGFHLSSVIVGILLLGLARGIRDGIRAAYPATQGLLGVGMVLSLIKGLELDETLVLLVVSGLLRVNRAAFKRKGYPLLSRRSLYWLLAIGVTLALLAGLGQWLGKFADDAETARYARALLVMLLTLLAWLAWTWFAMPLPRSMVLPDPAALAQARDFYSRVGNTTYSYLTLLADKYLFYTAEQRALLQYGQKSHYFIVMGDPAAADTASLVAGIHEFRRMAEDYNRQAVFYQVDEANLHHYLNAGFALLKLGERARVALNTFSLVGKQAQKYRTALNRGVAAGLRFEVVTVPLSDALWAELTLISSAWLSEKHGAEKGFSLGRFERTFLTQCGRFALVYQGERLLAFASITPDFAEHSECQIDLMRHVPDAPRGTMDFLFVSLMQYAAAAGYTWFDLGMAPLAGVGASTWSRREEQLLRLVYQYGSRFYNFKGLHAYKDKFNPEWRGLYLAYPRRASVLGILLAVAALVAGGYRQVLMK